MVVAVAVVVVVVVVVGCSDEPAVQPIDPNVPIRQYMLCVLGR